MLSSLSPHTSVLIFLLKHQNEILSKENQSLLRNLQQIHQRSLGFTTLVPLRPQLSVPEVFSSGGLDEPHLGGQSHPLLLPAACLSSPFSPPISPPFPLLAGSPQLQPGQWPTDSRLLLTQPQFTSLSNNQAHHFLQHRLLCHLLQEAGTSESKASGLLSPLYG